ERDEAVAEVARLRVRRFDRQSGDFGYTLASSASRIARPSDLFALDCPIMDTRSRTPVAGLPRELGPFAATAIVAGTVIGSGIFKKPQIVAENVPTFGLVALVWIAGGVLALLGALAYAEVATLYPRAGGNYVFLREGYGRLFGFLWGWVDFFMI